MLIKYLLPLYQYNIVICKALKILSIIRHTFYYKLTKFSSIKMNKYRILNYYIIVIPLIPYNHNNKCQYVINNDFGTI